MGKQSKHSQYPPIVSHGAIARRKISQVILSVLVAVSVAVGYYLLFSFLFDTPEEYKIRQSTAMLKQEYKKLSVRLGEIEEVLTNIDERDKNVYSILFESEPLDFSSDYGTSRMNAYEDLASMSNREMSKFLETRMTNFEYRLNKTDKEYSSLFETLKKSGSKTNNVPAIQPLINKDLTLMTASFGMRIHPFYKSLAQHNGIDYTVPEGSRVFATADGVVKDSKIQTSSSGVTVIISHGNGYETHYNHLSDAKVQKGQTVRRGDIIALTGNSGLSLSPHLHYEIRYKGNPVDPIHYFFMELSPKEYIMIQMLAQTGMQSFD